MVSSNMSDISVNETAIEALELRKISTQAGSALAGGGDLTGDRDLRIDIPNAVEVTTVGGADVLLVDTGSNTVYD